MTVCNLCGHKADLSTYVYMPPDGEGDYVDLCNRCSELLEEETKKLRYQATINVLLKVNESFRDSLSEDFLEKLDENLQEHIMQTIMETYKGSDETIKKRSKRRIV